MAATTPIKYYNVYIPRRLPWQVTFNKMVSRIEI